MAQRQTLTEKQVDLLRWISDACPKGVMEGDSHRVSAAALRRRGLVTTSGHGPRWSAKITMAGVDYLAAVDGDDPPIPRQDNLSVTQQLVNDILAAGGMLRVATRSWTHPDRVDYEHRARLAVRHGKVPRGKWLVTSRHDDELELRLVDASGEDTEAAHTLLPVAVPDRVGRYHAAARGFRDATDEHEVSRDRLPRATRILHAIAVEAERRGWTVSPVGGHVAFDAAGRTFSIGIKEEGVRRRGAWEEQVHHYRNVDPNSYFYRDRTLPRGPYDANAAGKLTVALSFGNPWDYKGRQSRWADRQSWALEERLPHLFREIEARLVEADRIDEEERIRAEQAAENARREAEERERTWHALIQRAKDQLHEDHRRAHLRTLVDAWQEAERIRRFCDAAERAVEQPDTRSWVAWARAHADGTDPLNQVLVLPEPPETSPETLQPYMPEGWSADGPDVRMSPRFGFQPGHRA